MARTRDADKDIDLGSGGWTGGTSDGTTLWFASNSLDEAIAYTAATLARDSDKDISLGTGAWLAGLSDGTTLWFVRNNTDEAIAYSAATQERDSDKDISFFLLGLAWRGGTSDGTTLWIVNHTLDIAYAYTAATQERDSDKDIELGTGNWFSGVSDGTTLWFVDNTDDVAQAYVAATQERDADKDIDLGTGGWRGGPSDGTTIWFVDNTDDVAQAYATAAIVLPDAAAPTLAITDVTSITEDETAELTATPTGGTYDTISYAWTVESGGGTLDTSSGASVVYTPADVAADTPVTIRCVATARGTGTVAEDGTSATVQADESFTVALVLPDAVASTLAITDITSITEEETAELAATPSDGTYDTIEYDWSVQAGGGVLDISMGATVVYTPPNISTDTEVRIRCMATVRGTGTNAAADTSAAVSVDESFTVTFIPPVTTISAQSIRYVPPDVDYETPVVLKCTAVARGSGVNAIDGTMDSVVVREMFSVSSTPIRQALFNTLELRLHMSNVNIVEHVVNFELLEV